MNKLYDAIEPTVIDDDLIRKCIQPSPGVPSSSFELSSSSTSSTPLKKEREKGKGDKAGDSNYLDFNEVETLKFSFMSMKIHFYYLLLFIV